MPCSVLLAKQGYFIQKRAVFNEILSPESKKQGKIKQIQSLLVLAFLVQIHQIRAEKRQKTHKKLGKMQQFCNKFLDKGIS